MKQPVPPVGEFNEIADLLDHVRSDVCLLLKEEIQLAKTELTEKESRLKRSMLLVVVGLISAYSAAIVLLIGIAILIALGLQATGLSPLLSVGLGAIAIFVLVGGASYLLLRKGVAALGESLLPEKTLQTLGLEVKQDSAAAPKDLRTSEELQSQVERRQDLLRQNIDTLKERVVSKRRSLAHEVKQQPFRMIYIAAMTTVASYQIVKRFLKKPAR